MNSTFSSIKSCCIRRGALSLLWFFCALCLYSCKSKDPSVGSSVLGDEDNVVVYSDTFNLQSSIEKYPAVISSPDSLMLGELDVNGIAYKCNILSQLSCPVGFSFPQNAETDSAHLILYFRNVFGEPNAPIYITANYIDKKQLYYDKRYSTDLNSNDYCSFTDSTYILSDDYLLIPSQCKDSVVFIQGTSSIYLYRVRIPLNRILINKLFELKFYESQDDFNNQFWGIVVSTSFGSSTILNVRAMEIALYYHFSYTRGDTYADTIVQDAKFFYANSEIKQVNTCQILNYDNYFDSISQNALELNYITSPIGIYTKINVPMQFIKEKVISKIGNKRPYVNMARVKLNTLFAPQTNKKNFWLQPPHYLVMVVDTMLDSFFGQNTVFTTSNYGKLAYEIQNNDTTYLYSFRLDEFLTSQLREKTDEDTLRLCIIPVEGVEIADASNQYLYLSQIKPKQTLSEVITHGAQNDSIPLVMEVVYSGF